MKCQDAGVTTSGFLEVNQQTNKIMNLTREIPELVKEGVITQEVADRISDYYQKKGHSSGNRLLTTFGVLGAVLVGLGLILILAHNWDELTRPVKLTFAFLPLIAGQLVAAYVILNKIQSTAWRESTSAFVFFAVGACISLVSQIYNIPGHLEGFLLLWMILCLPLIYLMKSSVASLLYIAGITTFGCFAGYSAFSTYPPGLYWVLLLAAGPHYFLLFLRQPGSNQLNWHHWMVPLSLIISLGTIASELDSIMFIAYFSLFGLFYQVGRLPVFNPTGFMENAYLVLGSLGTIILLLSLSFDEFWKDLSGTDLTTAQLLTSPELYTALLLTLLAAGLWSMHWKKRKLMDMQPIEPVFLLFICCYLLGLITPFALVLINVLALAIGVLTIRDGARGNHLGVLNYGLLIIAALVLCRFFDADLSFVIRGILFVAVGAGFFVINYRMLKKRKANGS